MVEAACESCSPCSCTPPHPTPYGLPHSPGPQGPHPSVARSRLGLWGGKGPLHLHPLPCPMPVRGLRGERGCMVDAEATRARAGRGPVHLLFHRPVTSHHPHRPPAGRPLSPPRAQPGLLPNRKGPTWAGLPAGACQLLLQASLACPQKNFSGT